MDIYLVLKNGCLRFLINPSEAEMENAEVLLRRLNVADLFQAGFPLIQKAAELIYLQANVQEMVPDRLSMHKYFADIFEWDVPGVLMTSWQVARGMAEAELRSEMEGVPQQPSIL